MPTTRAKTKEVPQAVAPPSGNKKRSRESENTIRSSKEKRVVKGGASSKGENKQSKLQAFINKLAAQLRPQASTKRYSVEQLEAALSSAVQLLPSGPTKRALQEDLAAYSEHLAALLEDAYPRAQGKTAPVKAASDVAQRQEDAADTVSVQEHVSAAAAGLKGAAGCRTEGAEGWDLLGRGDFGAAVQPAMEAVVSLCAMSAEELAAPEMQSSIGKLSGVLEQLIAALSVRVQLEAREGSEQGEEEEANAAAAVIMRHCLRAHISPQASSGSTLVDAAAALGDRRDALLTAVLHPPHGSLRAWGPEDVDLFQAAVSPPPVTLQEDMAATKYTDNYLNRILCVRQISAMLKSSGSGRGASWFTTSVTQVPLPPAIVHCLPKNVEASSADLRSVGVWLACTATDAELRAVAQAWGEAKRVLQSSLASGPVEAGEPAANPEEADDEQLFFMDASGEVARASEPTEDDEGGANDDDDDDSEEEDFESIQDALNKQRLGWATKEESEEEDSDSDDDSEDKD